jgi:hypothetical protein
VQAPFIDHLDFDRARVTQDLLPIHCLRTTWAMSRVTNDPLKAAPLRLCFGITNDLLQVLLLDRLDFAIARVAQDLLPKIRLRTIWASSRVTNDSLQALLSDRLGLLSNRERPIPSFAFGPVELYSGSRATRSKLCLLADWPLLQFHDCPAPRFAFGRPLRLYVRVTNDPLQPLSSRRSNSILESRITRWKLYLRVTAYAFFRFRYDSLRPLHLDRYAFFRVKNDPLEAWSSDHLGFVLELRTTRSPSNVLGSFGICLRVTNVQLQGWSSDRFRFVERSRTTISKHCLWTAWLSLESSEASSIYCLRTSCTLL